MKHLLVDGSNLIHAWPELRALLPGDREAARSRLAQAVRAIHDLEAIRVTLVFDGRGAELSFEPSAEATWADIRTPAGTTADDVIVQLVRRARVPGDCLVATDDRAERQAVEALGAAGISSADLAGWVGRARERQAARLGRASRENDRRWPG